MDNAKNQIVDIVKNNTNILVTVSTNPSVDELSAALGLTVLLNNMDKRATAVFSGAIPPAITFLDPAKTFENTADSLRDFIIALDKDKADHLRYKVDGDVVKIFITPYKTTLTQGDLDFSQGDYNVEVVLALGVKDQEHLDKALEAHGKILHDANVLTITAGAETSSLGILDWHDSAVSSLSEMVVSLADGLKTDKPLLDEQISTALLTGIVSATDRFSNDHTSPRSMTVAAQLMATGANQQLIAAKLEQSHDIAPGPVVDTRVKQDEYAPEASGAELTISRSDRTMRPVSDSLPEPQQETLAEPTTEMQFEETGDKTESVGEVQDVPADNIASDAALDTNTTVESDNQLELEKQLAGLTAPSTGTMADIEKELKDAVAAEPVVPEVPAEPLLSEFPQEAQQTEPIQEQPAPPIFPELSTPKENPEPALPEMPVPEPLGTPQIINEHGGAFSETPVTDSAPINSIQSNPNGGETTIDPFGGSAGAVALPPLAPVANVGTPEGAAALAMGPTPTIKPVDPTPITTIPELPPLPPLPPGPEDEVPLPLPPPPPMPNFDPAATAAPLGAVSGDIFGDGSTAPTPQSAPVASEPGQFKIPGQ